MEFVLAFYVVKVGKWWSLGAGKSCVTRVFMFDPPQANGGLSVAINQG